MRIEKSLLLPLAFLAVPLFAAEGSIDGSLTANGKVVALKHAYARATKNPFDKTKTDIVVLVTDQEVSPAVATDDIELMMAIDKQHLSGFTIQITGDKQIVSGTIFSPAFKKMTQFSGVGFQKLELTAMTPSHVAGTVSVPKPEDFFDNVYQYTATFDLPVSAEAAPAAPEPPKGKPLPAGGGDPGKAYLKFTKSVVAGDKKALFAGVTAARAKEMKEAPDFDKLFPLIQAMVPKNIKITAGAVDGDVATLLATGKDGDTTATGTITLRKEGGGWKVEREEWKSRSE